MSRRNATKGKGDYAKVKQTFDRRTAKGKGIGVNVEFFPTDGYLVGVDSLVVHTIGLAQRGYPEIVMYLGPRKSDTPILEEFAVTLSGPILNTLGKINELTALVKMRPLSFLVQGASPRRFMCVPMNEDMKERLRHSVLSNLSTYYKDYGYDFILYEPAPWIH